MKKILWAIFGLCVAAVIFANLDFGGLSLAVLAQAEEVGALEDDQEDLFWYFDTVLLVDGKAFGWGGCDNPLKLMYGEEVISDNPLVKVDSLSPTKCRLRMVTREQVFDLSDSKAMDQLQDFFRPRPGFGRYQKEYLAHLDSVIDEEDGKLYRQNTNYLFTLDYPEEGFPHREALSRWLCTMVSVAQNMDIELPELTAMFIGYNQSKYPDRIYSGVATDVEELGEFTSKKAFEQWRTDLCEGSMAPITIVTDYRAHIVNDKYVTYGAFVHSHEAPGHGMYTESFYTYDLEGEKLLTNPDIFQAGTMGQVWKLLLEEISKNKRYLLFNPGVETAEDVEERIKTWHSYDDEDGEGFEFKMPQGALTAEGVVFSFQPYEIECFAAGALHFTLPYAKLRPYLTPRALSLTK